MNHQQITDPKPQAPPVPGSSPKSTEDTLQKIKCLTCSKIRKVDASVGECEVFGQFRSLNFERACNFYERK